MNEKAQKVTITFRTFSIDSTEPMLDYLIESLLI